MDNSLHGRISAGSIAEVCAHWAKTQPQQTAYSFLDDEIQVKSSLTYAQLYQRAQVIAHELRRRRRGPDTTVLLLFAPGLPYVEAFLGCLFAGVIAVPAYPATNMTDFKRLAAIAADCRSSLVLTTHQYFDSVSQWLQQKQMHGVECVSTSQLTTPPDTELRPDNEIAFLQYTSGSTGEPKGVIVGQDNLMHNSEAIYRCFAHTPQSVTVSWLPPYHDMGLVGGILQPLYGGYPGYLMSPFTFLKQPKCWVEAVSKYRAYSSGGPNFAYELVLKHVHRIKQTLDLSSWKVAFTGAEPIRKHTMDRFIQAFAQHGFEKKFFYPCYGLAESTLIASGGKPDLPFISRTVDQVELARNVLLEKPATDSGSTALVSSGNSVANDIFIVDPVTCERLPDGRIGEIWLRGPSIAKGYWQREAMTRTTFQATTRSGEGPFLRSGDLGVLDDGEVFVTGRIKELVIINGQNHYPTDVEGTVQDGQENLLKSGAGVAFSHVVDNAEVLVIAQEVRREVLQTCDFAQLESAIKAAVFEYHRLTPHAVVLLHPGSIPKTSSGKLKRTEVKRLYSEGQLQDLRVGRAR